MIADNFLSKLIDWKEFEKFVAGVYEDSDDVVVKHNVTEIGKSGSPRQIDVLVLQKTKLHTIKYVIECKRWKEPVNRDVVDKIVATVEEVGANKGAIFTTKGYEDGALKYATQKNIDLFLVRDLLDPEWSEMGRIFTLILQGFHCKLDDFKFENSRIAFPNGTLPPDNIKLDFSIAFEPNQAYPERLNLYALGQEKSTVNYCKLLIELRNTLLKQAMDDFNLIISPWNEPGEIYFLRKIILDFKKYPYRFFKFGDGLITFDTISFSLQQLVTQEMMPIDLGSKLDFALVVENYITSQRNIVSKVSGERRTHLSNPIVRDLNASESEGKGKTRLIKYSSEHYVDLTIKAGLEPILIPDLTVNLYSTPPF